MCRCVFLGMSIYCRYITVYIIYVTLKGGDLQGVKSSPVTLNMPNKIVYSPHCYGPDVAYQDYFQASNFPDVNRIYLYVFKT